MHLGQPGFTYSAFYLQKTKKTILKFKETGDL